MVHTGPAAPFSWAVQAGRQENAACFFKFGTCCALSLPALSSPLPGRAAFLAAILRGSALDKNRRAIALAANAAKKFRHRRN